MASMRFGFLGLGAVATVFGKALAAKPGAEIYGYDVFYTANNKSFEERFKGTRMRFVGSPEQLAASCDIILSTVTTEVAVDAAAQIAPSLRADQLYIDMNSMTPDRKNKVAQIIGERCGFVEAAILGAVGATGAKTKILLGGRLAAQTAVLLNDHGLNAHFFSEEIGKASTFKMIRSVFSKGVEALLIEMMSAGKKAGLYDEILKDIYEFMSHKPFKDIGENWVKTHAAAALRRRDEMLQVSETLSDFCIAPIMVDATVKTFQASVDKKLQAAFPGGAESAEAVIDYLSNH